MKNLEDINLNQWFMRREVDVCPTHFIKCRTGLTTESLLWIREKLQGRYSTVNEESDYLFPASGHRQWGIRRCPTFEDPQEALFYELKFG